jgi:hypothetical protein
MLSATLIRTTYLPSGEVVPVLGQGTWGLAEGKHERDQEISDSGCERTFPRVAICSKE